MSKFLSTLNSLKTDAKIEAHPELEETVHNVERGVARFQTTPHPEFKRVKIGKLYVPASFYQHVLDLCSLFNTDESTIWQMFLMETLNTYADRLKAEGKLSLYDGFKQLAQANKNGTLTVTLVQTVLEQLDEIDDLIGEGTQSSDGTVPRTGDSGAGTD